MWQELIEHLLYVHNVGGVVTAEGVSVIVELPVELQETYTHVWKSRAQCWGSM